MAPLILDGKKTQRDISEGMRHFVNDHVKKGFVNPCLAIVQVGDDKASDSYIRNKKKFGESIGVQVLHIHLPKDISEAEVLTEIKSLNTDESVHGIILQLPLPRDLNKELLIEAIHHSKDVDGLTSKNVKGLWVGSDKSLVPATSRGILTLLKHYNIDVRGKKIVVIGRSALVGKPTAMLMLKENATVSICHSETPNIETYTLDADIIISAVGRPRFITSYHVRPGQIVIDVGITIDTMDKVCKGDVDFIEVAPIVKAISPVPGGVGPMTVLSLFQNLLDVYTKKVIQL